MKCASIQELNEELQDWLVENGIPLMQTKEAVIGQLVRKYIWYR